MAVARRAAVSEDVSNSRIVVSVALIVALAAIIGCLMWVKRRIRSASPIATPHELLPSSGVQPRKGIESYMLESIPVIVYRASLESNEQEEIAKGGKSAVKEPKDDAYKTLVTEQAELSSGKLPARHIDLSIKRIGASIIKDATHTMERKGSRQESKTCSICTEDFVEGRNVRILPCRHMYHRRCIDPWLLDFAGTCPLCRISLQDLVPTSSLPPRPPEPVVLASELLPVAPSALASLPRINSPLRLWR